MSYDFGLVFSKKEITSCEKVFFNPIFWFKAKTFSRIQHTSGCVCRKRVACTEKSGTSNYECPLDLHTIIENLKKNLSKTIFEKNLFENFSFENPKKNSKIKKISFENPKKISFETFFNVFFHLSSNWTWNDISERIFNSKVSFFNCDLLGFVQAVFLCGFVLQRQKFLNIHWSLTVDWWFLLVDTRWSAKIKIRQPAGKW